MMGTKQKSAHVVPDLTRINGLKQHRKNGRIHFSSDLNEDDFVFLSNMLNLNVSSNEMTP